MVEPETEGRAVIAVHLERGKVSVRSRPLPRRPRGFARIRMLAAGSCNTDLELRRGYYGFRGTPGHEFVGEVTDADERRWIGRRVTGEINLACRKCAWCLRGMGRHCPRRTVLGIVKHPGAFADYLTLPVSNLHPVPEGLSVEEAVFTEPAAAACEILEQVPLGRGARVAVLGDGKLGLLIAQGLAARGARVTQYGRHWAKLAIAAAAGVRAELAGDRLPRSAYPVVVDATGSPEGLRTAVAMAEPRGTVVMKSTVHGAVSLDTAPVIVNEITLVGSRCGPFAPALKLLAAGELNVRPLISGRFPLREAPRAFARAAEKGVLKVLLLGEGVS